MRLLIACILLVSILAGCSSQQRSSATAPSNVEAERAALDRLRDDYVAAFNASDAERVANIYALDAIVMPPNEPPLNGRAAIRDWFKGGFDQFTMKAALTSQEFRFMGAEWAFDRGTYTLTLRGSTHRQPNNSSNRSANSAAFMRETMLLLRFAAPG